MISTVIRMLLTEELSNLLLWEDSTLKNDKKKKKRKVKRKKKKILEPLKLKSLKKFTTKKNGLYFTTLLSFTQTTPNATKLS